MTLSGIKKRKRIPEAMKLANLQCFPANCPRMPQPIPKSPKQHTERPQETEFDTRLAGATNRLDSSYLMQLEKLIEHQENLEDARFQIRYLVTCLRGVRYELLNTDAARFGGLVKIIEKVIADCGWGERTEAHAAPNE